MRKVMNGCKVCGKRMLTDGSPLIHRTCDDCKLDRSREANRKTAARRKAERHAAKAKLDVPDCEQCGKAIEGAVRIDGSHGRPRWARKFCNNCQQAAFRARNGHLRRRVAGPA